MQLYMDIAKQLEQEVQSQFKVGEFLPSESRLADRFDVNRHTVRRAIDELVFCGLIERQQGRGNQVIRQPYAYPLNQGAYFTHNLTKQGYMPRCEVLNRQLITASEHLAKVLNIELDAQIIKLTTLRVIDGLPCSLIEHFLPNTEWWGPLQHFESGSLHQYIQQQLNTDLTRKSTKLRSRMPNRQERKQLKLSENIPLIIFRTVNVASQTKQVMEYSCSYTRSDMIEIVLEH
ncbi:phosphonate metabolism transcriptional regulator PhnF [Vibrio penaeicida]|uniref:phosphonate metabolism transcriptional regulator PhnF n=1 Tax=Vibrio penaeicida TaxID=104609 RepID=UPI000CE9E030|nr:phosphonate metabolism transcriptional regulator PhnF [Vibrio penaeicida]